MRGRNSVTQLGVSQCYKKVPFISITHQCQSIGGVKSTKEAMWDINLPMTMSHSYSSKMIINFNLNLLTMIVESRISSNIGGTDIVTKKLY